MTPKRFIRIWVGPKKMPDMFEDWWKEFQTIHPDYEFVTIRNESDLHTPNSLIEAMNETSTYAGRSDIMRILALHQIGGIYVDTDMMPLKRFDPLLESGKPFIGKRSSKSFATGVMASPPQHYLYQELIDALPEWFKQYKDRDTCIQTGPKFVSHVLFGRHDEIDHLPVNYFYAYDGFGGPKKAEKFQIFEKKEFPSDMYAVHFGNHQWGGKPKTKLSSPS
jgi:mannosyltransferase OCH1-like enzyme